MPGKIIIIGKRFGKLIVIADWEPQVGPDGRRALRSLCLCDCGKLVVVSNNNLRWGGVQSCGCLKREAVGAQPTHGHTRNGQTSGTYKSWCAMRYRCDVSTSKDYPRYGGRGITVCERWKTFANFLADMGERPAGTSLDRIENDKGYFPGNVRWATPKIQSNNRRPASTWRGKPLKFKPSPK